MKWLVWMNPQSNTPIHGQLFGDFVIACVWSFRQYQKIGGCLELLLMLLPFGPSLKKQPEEKKGKEPRSYIIKAMWTLIILGFIVALLTGFLTGRKPF